MRYAERRLQQDQAFGRVRPVDSAAVLRLDDRVVVEFRLVTEQRELETILAANRAVAVRVRASRLGEDRDDIFDETELRLLSAGGEQ